MYKVFVENKLIVFTEDVDYAEKTRSYLKLKRDEYEDKLLSIRRLLSESIDLVQICTSVEETLKRVFKGYENITTGGGLVIYKDEILVIERFGIIDLPKGKLEDDESPMEGALREVEEECGLSGMLIDRLLCVTFHTYEYKGKPVLKKNYWYVMHSKEKGNLSPQEEEGISRVYWTKIKNIDIEFMDSYASIKSVVEEFKNYSK